jgi:hypothetical protein
MSDLPACPEMEVDLPVVGRRVRRARERLLVLSRSPH